MALSESSDYETMTLGLLKTLGKRTEITDVSCTQNPPISRTDISAWEQNHSCTIPGDLRNFFLVTNGFSLKWKVKTNDTAIPVGSMKVNSIEEVTKLTLSVVNEQDSGKTPILDLFLNYNDGQKDFDSVPTFDHRSRIFELDPCDGYGKVCLVYSNIKPGLPAENADVWFLDRGMRWHFLSGSFLEYYRMMLVHLGLPQWQYAFTDIGLSSSAKQWFNLFCPLRLNVNQREVSTSGFSLDADVGQSRSQVQLDVAKVFKGKTDKKKPAAQIVTNQNIKKKLPFSPAKPSSGKSLIQTNRLNIK